MEAIAELRALLWDMIGQAERLRNRITNPEAIRLLNESLSSLREAHVALYFTQVELMTNTEAMVN